MSEPEEALEDMVILEEMGRLFVVEKEVVCWLSIVGEEGGKAEILVEEVLLAVELELTSRCEMLVLIMTGVAVVLVGFNMRVDGIMLSVLVEELTSFLFFFFKSFSAFIFSANSSLYFWTLVERLSHF